jgi:hypothetical protein
MLVGIVRRGQVLLDFDVVDRWDLELSQMNLGKVGEPYCYPDSLIELLGYMRAYFHLPYRQISNIIVICWYQSDYIKIYVGIRGATILTSIPVPSRTIRCFQ